MSCAQLYKVVIVRPGISLHPDDFLPSKGYSRLHSVKVEFSCKEHLSQGVDGATSCPQMDCPLGSLPSEVTGDRGTSRPEYLNTTLGA